MTDIDICDSVSWFYQEGMGTKSTGLVIGILADVVSKNGILLLNVPPLPDGTFAGHLVKTLQEIGDWLATHGEAIYGTIPWSVYGEGPSVLEKTGHYSEGERNASFTEQDFRFTQKGDILYAICLGVPRGEVRIRSLGSRGRLFEGEVASVRLLGREEDLAFAHEPMHLAVKMPQGFQGKHACVFAVNRKP